MELKRFVLVEVVFGLLLNVIIVMNVILYLVGVVMMSVILVRHQGLVIINIIYQYWIIVFY